MYRIEVEQMCYSDSDSDSNYHLYIFNFSLIKIVKILAI